MNKEQLVAALFEAVHPNGENGHGKTTAYGLRDFLNTIINELVDRTAAGAAGGAAGEATPPGSPAVLASPDRHTYRLTVDDEGVLGTEPANELPLPNPLDVLTSSNGISYRLTVTNAGELRVLPTTGLTDPDAEAFSTAAGLANAGHREAVSQLVRALKIGGVWPKLHALYPMVGGTARAHALNLKDPRDDDAAYRPSFVGSPRHSALGVAWDGATQYADTHFVPQGRLALNSCHLAYYATTTSPSDPSHVDIGAIEGNRSLSLLAAFNRGTLQLESPGSYTTATVVTAQGFSLGSQVDGHTSALYRDGVAVALTGQSLQLNTPYPNAPLLLAHRQDGFFSDRTCGLASVGEGLLPAEAQTYADAVRTFQQALGRDVAYDTEALAFAQAAGLTDQGQLAAVGELVRGLKASGVWPRLRACYPMVGGTEQAHRLNLIDPRVADTAFCLTFHNNPAHSGRGVEWRAADSTYAETHLVPRAHLSSTDHHLAYFAVTDSEGIQIEVGGLGNGSLSMLLRHPGVNNAMYVEDCATYQYSAPLAHGLGLGIVSRTSASQLALYRDGQSLELHGSTNGNLDYPTDPLLLGGRQDGYFSNKTCGFASIGLGLTPAQAVAYSATVRAFQRALGRDVTLRPELLLA